MLSLLWCFLFSVSGTRVLSARVLCLYDRQELFALQVFAARALLVACGRMLFCPAGSARDAARSPRKPKKSSHLSREPSEGSRYRSGASKRVVGGGQNRCGVLDDHSSRTPITGRPELAGACGRAGQQLAVADLAPEPLLLRHGGRSESFAPPGAGPPGPGAEPCARHELRRRAEQLFGEVLTPRPAKNPARERDVSRIQRTD